MADINTSIAPYYDDYDPSKHFTQILALPGRVEQAREFTQAQTIMLDMLKRLSSAILKEGSLIAGMGFTLSGGVLTVDNGMVYLSGIVHQFDRQNITLQLVGVENVGIKLVTTIITEANDSSLNDPAQGSQNYGGAGAHRVQSVPILTLNDPACPTIYTFVDGVLQRSQDTPQLEMVNKVLARRTYDSSGHYKVSGLTMWTKDKDSSNITLTVDAGKAYVMGFEVTKPAPTAITVPKAQGTRSVTGEPKTFATGTSTYLLNNPNAKQINQLIGTVQVTRTLTRGSQAGGRDLLPDTPVVSLVSVTAGGTTYTSSTDYQLSGNYVDWAPAGVEPSVGSSYTVVYRYNKTMIQGTDYRLTNTGSNSYADFSLGGDDPVNATTFNVDYDFYLDRKDRIYLDMDGSLTVVTGVSDIPDFVADPLDTDQTRLSLGTLYLRANSANVVVTTSSISRITMKEMAVLMKRLDNLEYNQALGDLDRQAMAGESPTTLKGIFTDGFVGFSKADSAHPLWNASIDIHDYMLGLSSTMSIYRPTVQSIGSGKAYLYNKYYSLGYTEVSLASQMMATGTINVNEYMAFTGIPFMRVVPEKDNWVDTTTTQKTQETLVTHQLVGWWKPDEVKQIGVTNQVYEDIVPYARQIDLEVYGEDYPADADNLTATIDGITVTLTPMDTTRVGTTAGTIKANADGTFHCKFTVPAGLRWGARQVVIGNPVATGNTIFTSKGINRRITQTVMTQRIHYNTVDPVAQSFQLAEDRFVTGVDLYFSSKDSVLGITVQLREMENGYPTNKVLSEVRVPASQVNISADGTVATPVKFERPALCARDTQYCFAILTSSNKYNVFIAELTKKSLTSNSYVTGQPYSGVLFTSSNALTWTAEQTKDLKFALKGAAFNPSATMTFNDLTGIDIDKLLVNADADTPTGTSVVWEYRLNGAGNWLPIRPGADISLPQIATLASLRVTLSTANTRLSPVLSGDDFTIIGMKTKLSGVYVSKQVSLSQTYSTVRMVVAANVPSGTSVTPQITTDGGTTWVTPTLSTTSPNASDATMTDYTYAYTVPSGSPTTFRARLNLSTSSRLVLPTVESLMNILK